MSLQESHRINPLNPLENEKTHVRLNVQKPTPSGQISVNRTYNGLIAHQTVEVMGVITEVNFPGKQGDPTIFKIKCPNIGKTFEAVCDIYCPIRKGDTINALCTVKPEGILYVLKSPFVQPAIDRDSMIQCFMRALKQGYHPSNKIYNTISKFAGGDEEVIPFLTGISQTWNDSRNSEILFMFGNVDPDNIKKLLNWWHRERNLRRLYLLGLTNKEINASRMTCEEIYQKCMVNPYTIPAIPINKCDDILDRLNKRPDEDERCRGSITRLIWKNLHENGWTGMPSRIISRQFPGIRNHIEALRSQYGIVAEMETVYLKFPHKVETFIADFIANKREEDLINYDTPLDEIVTLPYGKMIERKSAHFTRDLSEDQQRAIQGALDHTISIITGGAGTGKCLQIGTQILMFDGSIKKIEDIKEGELVMGPDSKPRTVLSKCFGVDDLFEIIPSKGRSFTCNTPHVLTLKGIEPQIETKTGIPKRYVVSHTVQGFLKTKSFFTEREAKEYIKNLPEDIFDIPLNEFMKRSKDEQKYCYTFHVGVDFPHKNVNTDPYLLGYWLGADSSYSRITLDFNKSILSENVKNIFNNKHIPDDYKINSRGIRLEILAGIIDSNGYLQDGCIEICEKNKRLSDDIEYVAFSLGFMITRTEYNCKKKCEVYQRMCIFGDGLDEIPLRKLSLTSDIKRRANCLRFDIKPKGKGSYCGFELDGDGRFLLGDFLVTHNTTALGQVIHNLELRGVLYAVCSFTGKAVSRIREVTKKRSPSTIHRLIANTRRNRLNGRSTQFEKDTPFGEYEHIIIDESSMVTTELLYDFLQAYPNIQKITLIGDVNQLPPIGWGCLFEQIVRSETIPTYSLTTNYRVYTADGDRDGIILNANAIVSHDPQYPFEFVQTNNFSVIEGPTERVYDIIRGCFSAGIKSEQLIVITPYNRYLDELNRTFQEIYNVGCRSITDSRGIIWRIGDRVMLTDNDNEIGVYNGESGTITDLTDVSVLVDFGQSGCHEFLLEPTSNARSKYIYRYKLSDDPDDSDESHYHDERTVKRLQHSFAITVDKSQGSEWDFVIFFIPEFNTGSFLNKNRIYTGITRAKRCCWNVVSDMDAFCLSAVKLPPYRCDNLSKRLSNRLPNLKPFRIPPPSRTLEMSNDLPYEYIPESEYDMGYDCDDFE